MAKKPASTTGSVRGATPNTTSTPSRAAHTQASTTSDATPTLSSKSANMPTPSKVSKPIPPSTSSLPPRSSFPQIAAHVWNQYLNDTPSRTLLLDVFMAFLVLVGVVQFVYCVIAGNYPFNAFLSGFSAAVGQFVLTASLRMQTSERAPPTASAVAKSATKPGEGLDENPSRISSERAFADFILGSLILHGFCVNFIN